MVEVVKVTATSDSGGDYSTVLPRNYIGRLVGIKVVNSADAQPSSNWDLKLSVADMTRGATTAVEETIFLDETVSNSGVVNYYPVVPAAKASDGSASTLTEVPPLIGGPLTITGSKMGDTKTAYIYLFIELI
jgi:hypothetical protein